MYGSIEGLFDPFAYPVRKRPKNKRGIPFESHMQRYPHVTIRFSIIIAFFRPKYSHVRPPPKDPIKDPMTNKLAVNQIYYQIIKDIEHFIIV